MVNFTELFEGMSVSEMKEALKSMTAEAKDFIKEVETKEKDSIVATAKASVKEGDTVRVKYKDEVISGEVVALRDKTFTILTSDILNAKGEPSKVSRNYNLIVLD
jgi:hypothetical protein